MKSSLTCGFIGLGLIGGSIAKALRKFHPDYRLIGYDIQSESTALAVKEGVLDIALSEINETFSGCDYIFLCAPVSFNDENLLKLKKFITPECLLTDVGSVKTDIHKHIEELGLGRQFIGGHPMTGSEKTGLLNSNAQLLENAYYIITPTARSDEQDIEDFKAFVSSLGSIALVLGYEEHDHATAAISHLPHMIAYSLVNLIENIDSENETMKKIAAGGFRDVTRIAASSPEMWESICRSNRTQLLSLMDQYEKAFSRLRHLVDVGDSDALMKYFEDSKNYRDSLTLPGTKIRKDYHEIFVDLADEAGGIAMLASLLAFKGISIKNIGIINNREFDEGVLRIEFYDDKALEEAIDVLLERNYTIHRR